VEVSLNAVQQSHGALYVAVIRDISERLEAEEKMRTALVQKAEAEARDLAKSRFLATMSHELRTPLNAILGYSELLAEDAEIDGNTQALTNLRKIQGAANHLLGLISEVLDLSKIEAGKMTTHQETFLLSGLVDEVVANITPLAAKNNNRFTVESAIAHRQIQSDPIKLRQVLLNLLANACKFTHDGEVSLSVQPETRQGIAGMFFDIRDTGIGITKAQLERLFMPFVQVDGSHTRTYGGTGLGLAISKHFMDMLGGVIDVSSTPGKGSSFSVWLPNQAQVSAAPESVAIAS
jgi:signal transduction histidine kinase